MTPNEMSILKSLVVVAWADGAVVRPEAAVIEGLLSAFDATPEEERDVLDFAKQRRTLMEDIPLAALTPEDRELLLANAALLTHADGNQSPGEKILLNRLVKLLGFTYGEAQPILDSARDGHLQLGTKVLEDLPPG